MSESAIKIIQAKFVAPMDRPMMRDAGVLIESDRIIALDDAKTLRQSHPRADVIDLPRHVLLPGLVNAHTHLELSNCACGDSPGGTFADWIISMRNRMRIDPANIDATIIAAVNAGIAQCRTFGVTCVGDITGFIELSRRTLRASSLRAVSFGEALGLAKLRGRFELAVPRAIDRADETDRLHIGISPHAPYTVDLPGYVQCLKLAREQQLALATHLAENADEAQFLKEHTGMFRDVWNKLGLWDDAIETFPGSPIAFAKSIGLLDYPALLAHVNYCDDTELDMLASGRASVVYCPRTHQYFGHPPHRWRQMLARGINVAVGTDSCASSPDLNLVDDLRLLRGIAPEIPAQTLFQLATLRAARAMQLDSHIGSITPGKAADLIAFEVDSDEPLEQILREPGQRPSSAWW